MNWRRTRPSWRKVMREVEDATRDLREAAELIGGPLQVAMPPSARERALHALAEGMAHMVAAQSALTSGDREAAVQASRQVRACARRAKGQQ